MSRLSAFALLVLLASCASILGDDFTVSDTSTATGAGAGAEGGGSGASGGGGSVPQQCGDGVLSGSEDCDDGNLDDDDGCDSQCAIEGSCQQPVALPEQSSDASVVVWTISRATSGNSQVGLAACDGQSRGSGPDRIYSFTTTDDRDLTVSVEADFPHAVRLLKAPCDLGDEVHEPDQPDGCAASGALFFPSLGPGSYYVVVDGAGASDAGSFSLTVTAACPMERARLSELRIGSAVGLQLENKASSCSVDLRGLALGLATNTVQVGPIDLQKQLSADGAPEPLLAPNQKIWIRSAPQAGDIDAGVAIPFSSGGGGIAMVCRGACVADGSTALDVVAFSEGAIHPTLPAALSFSPQGLSGIAHTLDESHLAYQRSGSMGKAPSFVAADWDLGFIAPTLFYDSFEDGNFNGWTKVANNSSYKVISFSSNHGALSVEVTGDSGAYQGLSYKIAPITPARISFSLRGAPTTSGFVGWFAVGDDDVANNDGLVQFRLNSSSPVITGQGQSLVLSSYKSNDWNDVVYENISWNKKTFDLYINKQLVKAGVKFWDQSLQQITRVHLFNTAAGFVHFDGIEMSD